jgi:hypothetical protein
MPHTDFENPMHDYCLLTLSQLPAPPRQPPAADNLQEHQLYQNIRAGPAQDVSSPASG